MQMNNSSQFINPMPILATQNTNTYLKQINPYSNTGMPCMYPLVYNGAQILPASSYFTNNSSGYQMFPPTNMYGYSMQNHRNTTNIDNKQIQYPTYNTQGMYMQNYSYYNQMNACNNVIQNNTEIDENSAQNQISDNNNTNTEDNVKNDTQNKSKNNLKRISLNKTLIKNDDQNQNDLQKNMCSVIKQSDSSSLSASTQQLFSHSDKFEINTKQEDKLNIQYNLNQENSILINSMQSNKNKIDKQYSQQSPSSQKIDAVQSLKINVKESNQKKNEENIQKQQSKSIQKQSQIQTEKISKIIRTNSYLYNKKYKQYIQENNNQIQKKTENNEPKNQQNIQKQNKNYFNSVEKIEDTLQQSNFLSLQKPIQNKILKSQLKNELKLNNLQTNSQKEQQQQLFNKDDTRQKVQINESPQKQNQISLQILPQEVYESEDQKKNQILITDDSVEIEIEDEEIDENDEECGESTNKSQQHQKSGKKMNRIQNEIKKIQKNIEKIILKKLFDKKNSLKLISDQINSARKKLFSNCTLNEFISGFIKYLIKQQKGIIGVSRLDRLQEHIQLKIQSAKDFLNYVINHEVLSSVFIKYIVLPIDKYTSLIKPEQQEDFQKIINAFTQNVFLDISKMEYIPNE